MTTFQLTIIFASLCGVGSIGVTYSVYKCLNGWTSEPQNLIRRRGDIELNEILLTYNDIDNNIQYPASVHLDSALEVYDIVNSGLDFVTILQIIDIIINFINNLFN
jgi:hypothetical protein